MKRILLFIILGIFLISLTSAFLGIYKQGENISVRGNLNATSVNASIYYPNSSLAVDNQPMTQLKGEIWNYSFSSTDTLGVYIYDYCDQNGKNCKENNFEVTSTGTELTTPKAIIYSVLFLILIFLFVITIFGISALPQSNIKDEEGKIISINNLKYLRAVLWMFEWMLLIAIFFISSNLAFAYLGKELFANILFTLFNICLALTPVIVILWFIWIFVRIFQDKKMKGLIERGIFPQGNL